MAMKPELKKAWVEALRSGKFRQTGGVFYRMDRIQDTNRFTHRFCAIGVLLHVAFPDEPWSLICDKDSADARVANFRGSPAFLARPSLLELGLTENIIRKVTNLNDTQKNSFAEIAGWIQRNVNVKVGSR